MRYGIGRVASVVGSMILAALGLVIIEGADVSVAQAAAFPKTTIKLGHVHQLGMSGHLGTVKFAELVKERTGGAVDIQVFPAGQLGNEKDLVEQVKNGVIQMHCPSNGMIANFQGYGYQGVTGIPYIFKGEDEEQQWASFAKLMRSPFFMELGENAAKVSGIRALDSSWWAGHRQLTTKKTPVSHPNDLKGLKIRTPDAIIQKLPMTILGASVTPMAWAEVYTALQMGVIDGQENPPSTIYENKIYEVQKHLALTAHMVAGQVLIVNEKFFQGLSPELRAIFGKAAVEAGEYQTALQIKANKKNLQDLKDKGMIVNEVNKAAFAEKAIDGWKEYEPIIGKGIYERAMEALR
jgi:tripartite ATP-independent transporter DctP family solute receptor